jgi:hypothetical protein
VARYHNLYVGHKKVSKIVQQEHLDFWHELIDELGCGKTNPIPRKVRVCDEVPKNVIIFINLN